MTLPSIAKMIRKEAARCDMRHKLGAVVLKNGKIISTAHNQRRHVKFLKKSWVKREETVCAERMALIKTLDKCAGTVVYVGRVNREGSFLMAKPCEACLNMMREVGVKKIFYTDCDGNFKEIV